MNSKGFFNQFYKNATELSYEKSLLDFFEQNIRARLSNHKINILELGGGAYSLFEEVSNLEAEVTSIDFSSVAILKAPLSQIKYREINLIDPSFFEKEMFDLVFDSHCLNCLTDETERELAFKNIFSSLKPGGLFASELMVQPPNESVSIPFKKIKSAMELEREILSHGFKILYFVISRQSGFTSLVEGVEVRCDLLRVVGRK